MIWFPQTRGTLPCYYAFRMRLNKQPLGSWLLTNTVYSTSRPGAELAEYKALFLFGKGNYQRECKKVSKHGV